MSRLRSKLRAGSSRYKSDQAQTEVARAKARAAAEKAANERAGQAAPAPAAPSAEVPQTTPPAPALEAPPSAAAPGPAAAAAGDPSETEGPATGRIDGIEAALRMVLQDLARVRASQRRLEGDNERLETHIERLENAHDPTEMLVAQAELVDELREELETARADGERAWQKVEELHGKLESNPSAIANVTLQNENDALRARIAELEAELDGERPAANDDTNDDERGMRHRLDQLEAELEQVKKQRKNLQNLLVERDSQVGDEARELSAEDITQSEVFKKLLAEFKETVRMEIGYLHNGIATLKDIHPEAYNAVLDHLDAYFEMVNVVNPLAALPKAEGTADGK